MSAKSSVQKKNEFVLRAPNIFLSMFNVFLRGLSTRVRFLISISINVHSRFGINVFGKSLPMGGIPQ